MRKVNGDGESILHMEILHCRPIKFIGNEDQN